MQSKQSLAELQAAMQSIAVPANSFWLWSAVIFAAFSFYFTLGLPSIGEEGVYTNITLEMLSNQNYLVPTLYGVHYSRPPLFNWLMIPLTQWLGVTQVIMAARIVNLAATLSTAYLLYAFVKTKFSEKRFALFVCAAYLSGDLLFKRGWLAYADSLFACCVCAAMFSLWLAVDRKQARWLIAAVLALSAAYLAKIHTAYIFYGITGLVLLWQHKNRKYLFSRASWTLHILAIAFPIAWTCYINRGYGGLATTWLQSQSFLEWPGIFAYLARVVVLYPLDVISRFLPLSLLAMWVIFKKPKQVLAMQSNKNIKLAFWITLLNILPYWCAPYSNIRYILPLYPFLSLLFAGVIWYAKPQFKNLAVGCLCLAVCIKYFYAINWLPYEHTVWRGDAQLVARAIQAQVKDKPLYTNDSTSSGLRVAVELNKMRYPATPLTVPPQHFSGYVILDNPDLSFGELIQTYKLRNNKLYLFFKASPS
jgi:4-amino-4-deoxy-L-arabinose transferase-like glycosyltransferase